MSPLGFPGGADAPTTRRSPVLARGGLVAAAHPLIVATGTHVLRQGGNAVDASVAAALTAAVVLPEMCGLGGDLFALVRPPDEREPVAVLGSGAAPQGATLADMRAHGLTTPRGLKMPQYGPMSIGVPGMVHAYEALLKRFGTLPLPVLAESAIHYAEHGFPVTQRGAAIIEHMTPLLQRVATTAKVFLPGGRSPRPGTLLRQEDLGRTLRQISSEGCGVFYEGELASRIAAFIREQGGALSTEDLARHETVLEAPLRTTYRDHTIFQTGLPSQGLIHLEALGIVESMPPEALARGDAESIHLLVEATKLAFADRLDHAVDPAFGRTPVSTLLSKGWAAQRFGQIDPRRAADEVRGGSLQGGDTTYLCVVDAQGMMVSLIQSVANAFGSFMVAGDTGVLMNNRVGRGFSLDDGHPNLYAPGKKTLHTLNCYLIADPSGEPVLVGGTPGGDGQPQWNLQAVVALIDAGLDVQAAIEQPRWLLRPGTDPITLPSPYELDVESRAAVEVMDGLSARGHRVHSLADWGAGGCMQLIARDPNTGIMAGGSDPRREGLVLGF